MDARINAQPQHAKGKGLGRPFRLGALGVELFAHVGLRLPKAFMAKHRHACPPWIRHAGSLTQAANTMHPTTEEF